MKLVIEGTATETPVLLSLVKTGNDITLTANGVEILWVMEDGRILLNSQDEKKLQAMGFIMLGGRVYTK
jgi:hypothetical protein